MNEMTRPPYLSLFSACGGMDLGLDAAGWRCVGQAEVDAWRRSILRRHWPDVRQWDDVRKVCAGENDLEEQPALIVGGFPCQDLSVAGKRKGLAGERSGLAFEFIRIVATVQPRWVLMENVPGLLSSNDGRDMAALIGEMADLGGGLRYGIGYRVLDSQFFGVPQRRRRVFIVAARADADTSAAARSAAEVLSIGTRCAGSHQAGRPSWPDAAPNATGRAGGGSEGRVVGALSAQGYTQYTGQEFIGAGQLVTPDDVRVYQQQAIGQYKDEDLASTLAARQYKTSTDLVAYPIAGNTINRSDEHGGNGPGHGTINGPAYTLQTRGEQAIAFAHTAGWNPQPGEVSPTLKANGSMPSVHGPSTGLRRLTPVECERLQGWPDDHTRWDADGNEASDARRYSATGDGVTAPVAEWIGRRILEVMRND